MARIELGCRKTCPINPERVCGGGYLFGGQPCGRVIEKVKKIISQNESANGITAVRGTSGLSGVDLYTTKEDTPNYQDWRTWTRVVEIDDGYIVTIAKKKRQKSG